jgi:hypothetical protein
MSIQPVSVSMRIMGRRQKGMRERRRAVESFALIRVHGRIPAVLPR